MNRQLPSIFDYYDFRKFLEEYRQKRKEFDPGFTHTYICYRLGQKNSKSYFANVINGVKVVTPEFINRFIELLELSVEEGNYFRALVNYNQTFNQKEKEYYLEQIVRNNRADSRLITAQEYSLYKEWHHSVIRAILDIFNFKDDFKWLSEMVVPPITVPQARKSIKMLQSLNLISRNDQGYFKPTDKTVRTEDYVHDEIIKHYQARCMEIAKLTLLGNTEQPKDFSTNILSVSEDGLKRIQQRLQKFREEIRALVQKDELPSDRVYHLDIQLFPSSRLPTTKERTNPGASNGRGKK
jgi:uncharacterized protein (TIGR02147 family)